MRIPPLLLALLVWIAAYLFFDNAFPPLLPKSLMIQYMVIVSVGILLYFSFDDERWDEFMRPLRALLRDDGLGWLRGLMLVAVPALVGWVVYQGVRPTLDSPVELRQVHPAPPSTLKVFGKSYNLTQLENPLRDRVIGLYEQDREQAMSVYNAAVSAGRDLYYRNCYFCHGDLLDGEGPFADAFINPKPISFQNVGTIAQLQEAFLFWRIATGGPGLPKEGTPWNSAMPVWHEFLDEEEIWQVITFLYDYVGQVPRIWDQRKSRIATAIKDELVRERARLEGEALYRMRCAVCHGEQGQGDGVAAERMYPKPRDFSLGLFKYKSTPGALPASDQDLFDAIKHGLAGTSMPAWKSLLDDDQIRSLIPVIKRFDLTSTWAPEDADDEDFDDDGRYLKDDFIAIAEREPTEGREPYTPESIARGREVFLKACKECHGSEARGNIVSGKRLEDDWGDRIWPRNLTKPWTYRATEVSDPDPLKARDKTIERIYQRLSIGISGTPMPAHRAVDEGNKDPISLADRWHVANYVYSLREQAAPAPGATTVIEARRVDKVPDTPDSALWQQADPVTLRLGPNIIKAERLFTPLNDSVTVRTLYSADEIAFLLEVDDRTDSRPGEPVSTGIHDDSLEFRSDAFAIELPKRDAFETQPVVVKPLYRHGDKRRGTTIWYWNAGAVDPPAPPRTALIDASGPEQALKFREGGDLQAMGRWRDGQWKVLFKRPRYPQSDEDVGFDEGRFIPVAFANWDGNNGEAGSRHTLTTWYWVVLPPATDMRRILGIPLGAALLVFLALLWLVRTQRKRHRSRS